MTLEHKILMLIDRGVRSADDLGAVLGEEPGVDNLMWSLIWRDIIQWWGSNFDHFGLTSAGLGRLNKLDGNRK